MALALDGLDVQLLAFVAPVILKEWDVEQVTFAPALAAALIGMAVGSSVGGWLGDRCGRRPILIASTIGFGIATIAAAQTGDVVTLTIVRFLSGLGFGAATPNGYALVTEWLPHRSRARAISILAVSAPLGGMIGAAAALILLPMYGWRGCFLISGGLTVLVGLFMFWLPESASFLIAKGQAAKAHRELLRITGVADFSASADQSPTQETHGRKSIFVSELRRLNIGGPLSFFAIAFVTYAITSWTPTVLTSAGLSMPDALQASFYFNSAAIGGALATAFMIGFWGSKKTLAGSCLAGIAAVALLCLLLQGEAVGLDVTIKRLIQMTIGLTGFATGCGMTVLYAVLAFGYPVDRRSTGIGFGVMAGRAGGIVAILSSGLLLQVGGGDPTPFFAALLVMFCVAAIMSFIIDRHLVSHRQPQNAEKANVEEAPLVPSEQ